jgi:hypothetical protein
MREAAPAYVAGNLDLELPRATDFNERPPQLGAEEFIRWCETMMELNPENRSRPESTLRQMCSAEFVM